MEHNQSHNEAAATVAEQIEAVLFYKAEPVTVAYLAKVLATEQQAIEQGIHELEIRLNNAAGSFTLVRNGDELLLTTSTKHSALIERIIKEEVLRDLGKAGLETIALILYRGPISRREIDHVRGVNSTFVLRNLLVRGLVDKIPSPQDQRSFLYAPSTALIAHLGITKREDLPEFGSMNREIAAVTEQATQAQKDAASEHTAG